MKSRDTLNFPCSNDVNENRYYSWLLCNLHTLWNPPEAWVGCVWFLVPAETRQHICCFSLECWRQYCFSDFKSHVSFIFKKPRITVQDYSLIGSAWNSTTWGLRQILEVLRLRCWHLGKADHIIESNEDRISYLQVRSIRPVNLD